MKMATLYRLGIRLKEAGERLGFSPLICIGLKLKDKTLKASKKDFLGGNNNE